MRYADNKPCKECASCIERAEAEKCRNCEGRTLQIFIRWMAAAIVIMTGIFVLATYARADEIAVTSNVSTVRGWIREQLTFDNESNRFSRAEFPTLADATSRHQVATNIPVIYAEATAAMSNDLAALRVQLDAQRARPVCTMIVTAGPNAALDRQNLTFVAVSNEVERVADGLNVHQWIYSSSILRSPPVMDCDITTMDGTRYGGELTWPDGYGTNAVEITVNGETYETYKATCHIATSATNLSVYASPWVQIARKGQLFNFGNRRLRINRVYACTTNDLSWCGRFTTTNGTEITGLSPFADRGRFLWTERKPE